MRFSLFVQVVQDNLGFSLFGDLFYFVVFFVGVLFRGFGVGWGAGSQDFLQKFIFALLILYLKKPDIWHLLVLTKSMVKRLSQYLEN